MKFPNSSADAQNRTTDLLLSSAAGGEEMAFVNEYVPQDDVKRYGLEAIDKRYRKAHVQPDWTVDRERDIYLRWMHAGREERADQHDFTFYWQGSLIDVRLKREGGGVRGGKGWDTWTLLSLNLPEELKEKSQRITKDFKEALTAYKDFGVYSTSTEHTASFKF